jgi:hypothetical protein
VASLNCSMRLLPLPLLFCTRFTGNRSLSHPRIGVMMFSTPES